MESHDLSVRVGFRFGGTGIARVVVEPAVFAGREALLADQPGYPAMRHRRTPPAEWTTSSPAALHTHDTPGNAGYRLSCRKGSRSEILNNRSNEQSSLFGTTSAPHQRTADAWPGANRHSGDTKELEWQESVSRP